MRRATGSGVNERVGCGAVYHVSRATARPQAESADDDQCYGGQHDEEAVDIPV